MQYESVEEIEQAYGTNVQAKLFAFFFSPTQIRVPGLFLHMADNTVLFAGELSSGKIFGLPVGKQKTENVTFQFDTTQIGSLSLVLKKEAERFCQGAGDTPPHGLTTRKRLFREYVTQIVLQSGEVLYFETPRPYEIIDTLPQNTGGTT